MVKPVSNEANDISWGKNVIYSYPNLVKFAIILTMNMLTLLIVYLSIQGLETGFMATAFRDLTHFEGQSYTCVKEYGLDEATKELTKPDKLQNYELLACFCRD